MHRTVQIAAVFDVPVYLLSGAEVSLGELDAVDDGFDEVVVVYLTHAPFERAFQVFVVDERHAVKATWSCQGV